ncbi:hypothetical protein HY642_00345 [Candidatus Woesearchaeota archaeon]|nr:hypothetical protein [Candidatus Woesearchaeota archaeon]
MAAIDLNTDADLVSRVNAAIAENRVVDKITTRVFDIGQGLCVKTYNYGGHSRERASLGYESLSRLNSLPLDSPKAHGIVRCPKGRYFSWGLVMEKVEGQTLDGYIVQHVPLPMKVYLQLEKGVYRIIEERIMIFDTAFGINTLVTSDERLYFIDADSFLWPDLHPQLYIAEAKWRNGLAFFVVDDYLKFTRQPSG